MHPSSIKVVDRKSELRSLADSVEFRNAAENKGTTIVEVDLSHNQLDNVDALDIFPNLKLLILDHNNFTSMNSFPVLSKLETLSLTYNGIRALDTFLVNLSQKFPNLKHLNVMKNPMNPMFDSDDKYSEFRATVKIWLPQLNTLDGTDFSLNQEAIRSKQKEVEGQKNKALANAGIVQKRSQPLETIHEESKKGGGAPSGGKKNVAEEDILKDLKKNKAGGAPGGSSYQFNQRAYKKYHSTRSLVERILKSHSEGNRFIRNEDL